MSLSLVDRFRGSRGSVPEVLRARAAATPDRTFLLWRGKGWSFADAVSEAQRFAGFLQAQGYGGPCRRVASYLENRPEVLWTWFGTQLTGATYVSLNREHRGEMLADMLVRSRVRVLVTDAAALSALPSGGLQELEVIVVVDEPPPSGPAAGRAVVSWAEVAAAPAVAGSIPDPGVVGTLMFTSGTTGRSKAVLLPHNMFSRGAANLAHACGLTADDVFHAPIPLYHVGGQLHVTVTMLLTGGAVALHPRFSASRFWERVRETNATLLIGFPVLFHILLRRKETPKSTLRLAIGQIPKELHRPFERRFGIRLVDSYGMTEMEPLTLPPRKRRAPVGSCGLPGPDFEVAVVGADDTPLSPGEIGEIVARPRVPDVMFRGYEGDEAATVEVCRNLWFHTGDVGTRDEDGFLYWVDRKKHLIRRRGENVSSFEVERILEGHPAVKEAAVLGVPAPMGEDDVKAVVVPKVGRSVAPPELHAYCIQEMAAFMVPRYIEVRGSLPRSRVGKVRKELLREAASEVWDAEAQGLR